MNHAILLISCPDQRGITATVTDFIYKNNGNIIHADQHIDDQDNIFFMRIEWDLDGFKLPSQEIQNAFEPIVRQFNMHWELSFTQKRSRVAIMVSRHLHVLQDLLLRHQSGQLDCDIPLVISNHPEAQKLADFYGMEFVQMNVTPENKSNQEQKELALLRDHHIDLIVLARYHQILTNQFIEQYPQRIINIHHSFLPAFAGGKPYHQAYSKGVKIIGATSHFVVETLDAGPIIEQDTVRISHRDTLNDLIQKGEDLEKAVLFRAVRWALEKKILCYQNKTVIFD